MSGKLVQAFSRNRTGIGIISISSLLVAVGQFCWKKAGGEIGWFLVIGFVFYGIGAVLMTIAFRFGSLSVIHPFLSISYVFSLFLGWIAFDEPITFPKVIGILLVMIGVVFISAGDIQDDRY